MRVVTVEQMQRMDSTQIAKNTPGRVLMDRAGKAVAKRCQTMMESKKFSALVLAGGGNNGGDGWVAARYLKASGASVLVLSLSDNLTEDSKYHFDLAIDNGVDNIAWDGREQYFENCDIIIDALLGTGSRGAPRGKYRSAIEAANRSGKPILAVDIPSGVSGDTGESEGVSICADVTVTMATPKIGHIVYPGRSKTGELFVADIGIDTKSDPYPDIWLFQLDQARRLLPPRKPDGHKGDFGKGYILAGSAGMSGAAALTSLAFMKSGGGLAYLGTSERVIAEISPHTLEIVKHPLPSSGKFGSISKRALGEIKKRIVDMDVIAIGPGLARHHETRDMIKTLVKWDDIVRVIDADGINALSQEELPLCGQAILTPHIGELSRLLDISVSDILSDRFMKADEWAKYINAILLIKGSPTLIADPSGKIFVTTSGNSGMATAGSGDVLTGVISSFAAQGLEPFEAAALGAFVHGVAGDMASVSRGQRGMTARDILEHIPDALMLIEDEDYSSSSC